MSQQITKGEVTGLSAYIRNQLFANWKKDRTTLETKWRENENAFNAVNEGIWKTGEGEDWRSDSFINVTKIKVMSAYSLVIDMELQGGKIPFTLLPSPWDQAQFDNLPPEQSEQIQAAIDDMKALIEQQFYDCKADRELMKCVMSGAKYGETLSKRIVAEIKRAGYKQASLGTAGGFPGAERYMRYERFQEIINSPAVKYVSLWNIWRDLSSDDLQAGVGIIERDFVSPYDLQQYRGKPLYIDEAILRAISQADEPGSVLSAGDANTLPPYLRDINHRHNTIERLEFWGRVPTRIVQEFEAGLKKGSNSLVDSITDYENDGNETEIMAQLAGDEVIRFCPVETGSRPYDRAVWELNLDHTAGNGVADNLKNSQKVLNGFVRAFEDNKKLSGNVITVSCRKHIGNWDGTFKPGTEIEAADTCDDARKALQQIVIQDVGATLLEGIHLFERYSDEDSQLPKIMQGEVADKKSPDTAYEMNQLVQNAGKYVGGVIRNYDEGLVEPWVGYCYEYNMDDPDCPIQNKGNFIPKALGFTSFQDRVERLGKIMQAINLALSHELIAKEVKFRELLEEIWKALDIDPAASLKTTEEKETEQQRQEAMLQAQQAQMIQMQQLQMKLEAMMKELEARLDMEKEQQKHEHRIEEKLIDHANKADESDKEFGREYVRQIEGQQQAGGNA